MNAFPAVAAPPPVDHSPPPGNPDQLRATRDAFGAAAATLTGMAPWVRTCGTVDGWVGPAADAYRDRMAGIAERIGRAGEAMHDAAVAFGDLAARLEDARALWLRAARDHSHATRLLAEAHEEADQALSVARARLGAVTAALHVLREQAKAPLPPSPVNGAAPNPCGVWPQEASSAFWDNGIIPLDTVCIAYTDVILEVDGEPVSVLQAIPLVGPGDTDAKGKKPRNRVDRNSQDAIPPEVRARVIAGIQADLKSIDEGKQFQAQAAQAMRAGGVRMIGYGRKVVGKYRTITDVDVETEHAMVEITKSDGGKLDQVLDMQRDRRINPEGKAVALYAPNYTDDAKAAIAQRSKTIPVFRDMNDLIPWLVDLQR